ncbi:MAG: hypothetical protein HC830_12095 [Bacteroidetes bacterium]|nr:hypothetical protein [Bacteroidota bacterium]
MIATKKAVITVEANVNAPVEKVWDAWTTPHNIIHWNAASDDWFTPWAENDLKPGGNFVWRMESRDGKMGFDFSGKYTSVEPYKLIENVLDDGRKVKITFESRGDSTYVKESFEAEQENSLELQQTGWQAILDNFKKYVEKTDKLKGLHFEIVINASVGTVYQNMIDAKSYSAWTAAFNPTSRFEGTWDKGASIRFLGTDQDGSVGGMISRIRENIPNKFISIEHLGMITGDKEITSGPEVESWAGALENYSFREENGKTILAVDTDSNEEFETYFKDTWPLALQKLKEICEFV